MLKFTKMMYDKSGPQVVKALQQRRFDAYYCSTVEEALAKALELIPESDVVSWGGSLTIDAIGLKEQLKQRGQKVLDRDAVETPQDKRAMMVKGLSADTFITGSNAITEDGQLLNLDGNGNRVAAMTFGPTNVVIVAGMNKVAPDLESAYDLVRHRAAPANAQRFAGISTPCSVTGQCADCKSEDCICAYFVHTRLCRPAGKIKVILVGEELGL